MTVDRQYEIVTRMGPVRGPEYIQCIFQVFAEMLRRWADEDWKKRVEVITRDPSSKT